MSNTIALIGNPNCGKSTLFNTITNSYQKTGNWTGVTTAPKISKYKHDKSVSIVDLPGIYSFDVKSDDEKSVLTFIKNTPPKAIINIVDGTNLQRNLYLTLELINFNIPVVIAVNMVDQLESNKMSFDKKYLEDWLGVPVVPISALKNKNIDKLMEIALVNKKRLKGQNFALYNGKTLAEQRYLLIESKIDNVIKKKITKQELITQKIDRVIMHKFFALPIFFCVLTIIYYMSISLGGRVGYYIENAFSNMQTFIKIALLNAKTPQISIGLVCSVIDGLGTVFSLLPQILILYALLTILELSGYASRIAFILHSVFNQFGLSGKSLVPMLVSCGCTVAGLSATRTIESKDQRRMSIFLTPFMPCGAKMAVFGHFAHTVFNGNALVASSMYLVSILAVAVFGKLLKNFKCFSHNDSCFILEMPLLKVPSIKDVYYVLIEKIKDFIIKVGLIVVALSIILWFLKSFGVSGYVGQDIEKSFVFFLGNQIKYIFYPLGFGSWQTAIAVICGLFAKEGIVETLELVALDNNALFNNQFCAYGFMVFVLLSPPCLASLITAKRELGSNKWFVFMLVFQFVCAYVLALIINLLSIIIKYQFGLILIGIIAIIILLKVILSKSMNLNKKEKNSVTNRQNYV